jgi:hypothetical protein
MRRIDSGGDEDGDNDGDNERVQNPCLCPFIKPPPTQAREIGEILRVVLSHLGDGVRNNELCIFIVVVVGSGGSIDTPLLRLSTCKANPPTSLNDSMT